MAAPAPVRAALTVPPYFRWLVALLVIVASLVLFLMGRISGEEAALSGALGLGLLLP